MSVCVWAESASTNEYGVWDRVAFIARARDNLLFVPSSPSHACYTSAYGRPLAIFALLVLACL